MTCRLRDRPLTQFSRRRWFLGADLQNRLHGVGAIEGRPAGEQLVEMAPQGIDVHGRANAGVAIRLLRGHVLRRTQDVAGDGCELSCSVKRGQAEVADLGPPIAPGSPPKGVPAHSPASASRDIAGLQIAVDDAAARA